MRINFSEDLIFFNTSFNSFTKKLNMLKKFINKFLLINQIEFGKKKIIIKEIQFKLK